MATFILDKFGSIKPNRIKPQSVRTEAMHKRMQIRCAQSAYIGNKRKRGSGPSMPVFKFKGEGDEDNSNSS